MNRGARRSFRALEEAPEGNAGHAPAHGDAALPPPAAAPAARVLPPAANVGDADNGDPSAAHAHGNELLDAIIARDVESKQAAAAKAKLAREAKAAEKKAEKDAEIAAKLEAKAAEKKIEIDAQSAAKLAAKAKAAANVAESATVKAGKGKGSNETKLPVAMPSYKKRVLVDAASPPEKRVRHEGKKGQPSICHEKSRNQWLGRTGFKGKNCGNVVFIYGEGDSAKYSTYLKAQVAARERLKAELARAE